MGTFSSQILDVKLDLRLNVFDRSWNVLRLIWKDKWVSSLKPDWANVFCVGMRQAFWRADMATQFSVQSLIALRPDISYNNLHISIQQFKYIGCYCYENQQSLARYAFPSMPWSAESRYVHNNSFGISTKFCWHETRLTEPWTITNVTMTLTKQLPFIDL
jgi:hypothetical protein